MSGDFERELARGAVVDRHVEPGLVDIVVVGDRALGREDDVRRDGGADAAQGRRHDGWLVVDPGNEQPDRRIADDAVRVVQRELQRQIAVEAVRSTYSIWRGSLPSFATS